MALVPIERQVNVATVAPRLRQQMGLKSAATKEASEFATAAEGALATTALQPSAVGTAAAEDVEYFASAAQGNRADTAVQPEDLSTVATSGEYADLTGKPPLPLALAAVNALTVNAAGDAYKFVVPGLPTVDQFKTAENTWAQALTAAKAYMAALGDAAGAPQTGLFVVPAGIDVGNANYDFQDTRVWYMPGSKVYGNNHPRIEHHVRNLQTGYQNHQDHTFSVMRFYDAERPDSADPGQTNGYLPVGAGMNVYAATGQYNPAIGTPFSLHLGHEVFDTGTPDVGTNEPAGIYNYLAARNGRTQNKTNFWSQDNHLITPKIAPGWAGLSVKLANMAAQPEIDADYAGVVGWSICHRIPLAAELSNGEPSRVGDSSYTAFAALAINGYAGEITEDNHITSGTHAEANAAFAYAIKIGGAGGTPYMNHLARSKFKSGISTQDFEERGIEIINPHPSHSRDTGAGLYLNGADIVIDGPAGTLRTLSFRTGNGRRAEWLLHSGAESGSDAGSDLRLNVFGDAGAYLSTPLSIVRATGRVQIKGASTLEPLQLASYTVTTLPSAATYARGLIYVSNGTGNKRLAISDGTNWRFPDGAIVS